jgi:hypothetical protein
VPEASIFFSFFLSFLLMSHKHKLKHRRLSAQSAATSHALTEEGEKGKEKKKKEEEEENQTGPSKRTSNSERLQLPSSRCVRLMANVECIRLMTSLFRRILAVYCPLQFFFFFFFFFLFILVVSIFSFFYLFI